MTGNRILALAAVCLAVAAASFAATARAGTTAGLRVQHFTVYSANISNKDSPLLVEADGPIGAIGAATANDDGPGTAVPLTFAFPKGKVFLTAHDDLNWKPNLATCTATEDSNGTFTITGGTGAYRNVTGRGTFVEHGAAIGARSSAGRCLQRFKLNYVIATLTGKVGL